MATECALIKDKSGRGRALKQTLTLIPEQDRAISYRFNIALVGGGAKDFATLACESELAHLYKPSADTPAHHVALTAPNGDDGADEQTPAPMCKTGSIMSGADHHHDDPLVLFSPVGGKPSEVARLRFLPIEKFSQALPAAAKDGSNQIVVFLFWRICDDGTGMSSTDERITDFMSRMAEINHMPAYQRPYTTILAFETVEDQLQQLQAFVDRQTAVHVKLNSYEDDAEDTLIDAMQSIVDDMIAFQRRRASLIEQQGDAARRSKACALL